MSDTLDTAWALNWIRTAQEVISEHRMELIDLDREIGDGDHGENMYRGFTKTVEKLADGTDSIASALGTLGKTLLATVGGAAGPLYGTAFREAGKAVEGQETIDANGVVAIIQGALDGIVKRGKATTGEKTMVDAWTPALEAAKAAAAAGKSPAEAFKVAAEAAAAGAEETIPMLATKGRASYLGERSIGHKDPGATSTSYILAVAADTAEAAQ
ncbi:MAG: dihydroxyacetone kinase subunit L [Propionibacteriaceae bacterium]|jgi:dihydroxyacetone kinase-like protein|nr:dihydroxyacetone kinase subunit L [Propionibacteriaceae bacterium]